MVFKFISLYHKDLVALKLVGVFANEKNNYLKIHKLYFLFLNIFLLFIVNTLNAIEWLFMSDGLKTFAEVGYIVVILMMSEIKSIFLFLNRNELGTLLSDLDINVFQPRGETEMTILKNGYSMYWKIRIMLLMSCWTTVFNAVGTALLSKTEYMLPVPSWYPMDIKYSPLFEIVFIHQSVTITLMAALNIYTDLMAGGFLSFVAVQCDLLSYRLEALGKQEAIVKDAWVECIQHHKLIVRYLSTIEQVFGKIYFAQIFAATIAMCMALFLLSLAKPGYEYFYFVIYLIAVANLLLVLCWFATKMTTKSENIPIAAYNCNWIDAPNSFKKDIIIFIARSQNPMKLRAAEYFEMSIETFVKIIRASLSYFAVLQNLNMAERDQYATQ